MSDHDDKLDEFLKKNSARVPEPPPGEMQRIWRAIEAQQTPAWHWRDLFSLPQIRVALPALAVLVVILGTMHAKKVRHDQEVERVLAAALSFQMEDAGEDSPF
ncbi:MAG: hypothetical protein ACXVB9_06750 [Bdellovibrionota bacterium]